MTAGATPAVSLRVQGRIYGGWKTVEIARSIERAAAAFSLTVSDRWFGQASAWEIPAGADVTIEADGDPLLTGYVDRTQPAFSVQDHGITVVGRSRTGDLVDCSAVRPGGQWRGVTLAEIAADQAGRLGVTVVNLAGATRRIPNVQLQQGETVFALLERLARLDGVLLTDDEAGRLVLRRAGSDRTGSALVQGRNVKLASAGFDMSERFSVYQVKAQTTGFDDQFGEPVSAVRASSTDPDVLRHRPLVVVAEATADTAAAQARARWEARRRAGRAVTATVTVQGWRQADGRLWRAGELAPVRIPYLFLERDMIIGEVTYRIGDQGSTTDLSLALPGAFDPEPQDPEAANGAGIWRDVRSIDGGAP